MAGVDAIASTMGIASFGITLLDGIKKAKEFWDAMKEAPDDMQYALKELDTLKLVLEDIRIHDTDPTPIAPAAASQCLTLCREGVEMLEKLVKDLNSVVDKRRRLSSAKVVLKKETIKKLQDRLNSAQRMLLLCRQTFAEAQQASYHTVQIDTFKANTLEMQLLLQREMQRGFQDLQTLVAQSSNQVAALHASPMIDAARKSFQAPDCYEGAIIGRSRRSRRKTEKPYFQSKIRMPLWFSRTSRTWDFAVYEIPSGWKHVFRQYYTFDSGAPVFGCIAGGDLEGVRELLAIKRITPFDRDVSGITLLDYAAVYMEESICSLLLEEGADVNDSCQGSSTYLACGPRSFFIPERERRNNVLRRLLSASDDFSLNDGWGFAGNIDDLLFLLRLTSTYWRHLPLEVVMRFVLRANIAYKSDCSSTVENVLELILGEEELDKRVTLETSSKGTNLLRMSAVDLNFSIFRKLGANAPPGQFFNISLSKFGKSDFEAGGSLFCPRISGQIRFVLRLITLGSDVHNELLYQIWRQERSILETIILRTFENLSGSCGCCILSTLPPAVRVWLEILYEAGVDLLQYGKEELRIFQTDYISYELLNFWRMLFFTYGPTPNDWEFRLVYWSWDKEYNRYRAVRQFWNMVENPECNIPGAWEADFDDASSDSSDISESDVYDLGEFQIADYCRFRSLDS